MSSKVVNTRLKNGQCIHCGVQTHQVVKKGMFSKPNFVPLNVPGTVENGRCMLASCIDKGNEVPTDESSGSGGLASSLGGISASTAGKIAVVAGAAMAGLEIPIIEDVGEFTQNVGEIVTEVADNSGEPEQSYNPYSSLLQQQQQIAQQQNMALAQQMAQMQQAEQQKQMEYMRMMNQMNAAAAPQAVPVPGKDQSQKCPSDHPAPCVTNVWPGFTCNYCTQAVPLGANVYYCQTCDWGTCEAGPCRHRGALTPPMTCPMGHQAHISRAPPHQFGFFCCDVCTCNIAPSAEIYRCFGCPNPFTACLQHGPRRPSAPPPQQTHQQPRVLKASRVIPSTQNEPPKSDVKVLKARRVLPPTSSAGNDVKVLKAVRVVPTAAPVNMDV